MKYYEALNLVNEKRRVHFDNVQKFANKVNPKEWEPYWEDGSEDKFIIVYNKGELKVQKRIRMPIPGCIYFSTSEHAKEAINLFKDDLMYLIGTPYSHITKEGNEYYLVTYDHDVLVTAMLLLKSSRYVTNLEIKTYLRSNGFFATQGIVSSSMDTVYKSAGMDYDIKNNHRMYYYI